MLSEPANLARAAAVIVRVVHSVHLIREALFPRVVTDKVKVPVREQVRGQQRHACLGLHGVVPVAGTVRHVEHERSAGEPGFKLAF